MKSIMLTVAAALLSTAAAAQDTRGVDDGTSLGDVTKQAIGAGFDQGGHASDPSDDGVGRDGNEGRRSGLANVVDRGDLSSTIDVIDGD